MSMHPQNIPDIPQQTVDVARGSFPKGNIYMEIRDTLGSIFDSEAFLVRLDAWLAGIPLAQTRSSRFKQLQPQGA